MNKKFQTATFGAGCFWHVEESFGKLQGVTKTSVGYMGGRLKNPKYEEVCTDKTGHAEVLQIEFDPKIIKYSKLLEVFFQIHNPTTLNRQGPDFGTQYRSVIFYHDASQKKEAESYILNLEKSGKFRNTIVTKVEPANEFYRAEEYHQKYFEKNKGISCNLG